MEKKLTWILGKLSSLKDRVSYGRPLTLAGCNWRVCAFFLGDRNHPYLAVFLELLDAESLPPGWSRDMKYSFTLVNQGGKSDIVSEAESCFDAKNKCWGFKQFVSCTKLDEKSEGFVMNDKLIIRSEVQVILEETVKISESQSTKEGTQAVEKETENSSDENSDEDDDGKGRGLRLLEILNAYGAGTEVSKGNNDDATEESSDEDDDDSSIVWIKDTNLLNKVKSAEDTSQKVDNGTETTKENQPVKESIDVNGFKVSSSQVESVSRIFERHPDIASDFRPKNQEIRTAYMNELLTLIETLCQSPEKLSEDDLSKAEDTLGDLIDVGFKLDWLKTKVTEVTEKKKKEQGSVAKIQTMEEQLEKLKLMFMDLETQLQKEKAESLAARTSLSFNDVV